MKYVWQGLVAVVAWVAYKALVWAVLGVDLEEIAGPVMLVLGFFVGVGWVWWKIAEVYEHKKETKDEY